MARFLDLIKDPEEIAALEDDFRNEFKSGEVIVEQADDSFQLFLDDFGDLGVAQYAHMQEHEMYERLGLSAIAASEEGQRFPFFNVFRSTLGELPEDIEGFYDIKLSDVKKMAELGLEYLKLRWHQLVGVCAIVDRCADGKNVILADTVGLGKTCICFLAMAYVRYLRVFNDVAPPICEWPRLLIGLLLTCSSP